MKKIFSVFLMVIILLFSMIPCVSATSMPDENEKCSITVDCKEPGFTYVIYQIATVDYEHSTSNNISYIVDGSLSTATPNETVNINADEVEEFINNLHNLRQWPDNVPIVDKFTSDDNIQSSVYKGLSHGLYYIRITDTSGGITSVSPVGLSVPYYDKDSGIWIYESSINLQDCVTEPKDLDIGSTLAIAVLFALIAGLLFALLMFGYDAHLRKKKLLKDTEYDDDF